MSVLTKKVAKREIFASVEEAIHAIGEGKIVVVVDDENRENEGDLIMAAEHMTEEAMAFFVRYTSGVVCVALTEEKADALELPLMVEQNTELLQTAFTVTIDLREGTTTGISASDRAKTIASLAAESAMASDYNKPGHVFPLRARKGGVLERPGHTEAAVDLARLAGLAEVGALCEIVNDDGTMARLADIELFCETHDLLLVSIADLADYQRS